MRLMTTVKEGRSLVSDKGNNFSRDREPKIVFPTRVRYVICNETMSERAGSRATAPPLTECVEAKRRRGGPRATDGDGEAAARKAERNRIAQRNFRTRKDMRIKELELKVHLLSTATAFPPSLPHSASEPSPSRSPTQDPDSDAVALIQRIQRLEHRCNTLVAENAALKASGNSPTPPLVPPSHWASEMLLKVARRGPLSPTVSLLTSDLKPADAAWPSAPAGKRSFLETVI
ncbi:hypothetical protein BC830DRAFT_1126510 [Chytriomyces sp. MP71]|nr:hypothetical protein BC830DRAFT_1126510 [Chytriomyces sp. MP71]